MKLGLQVGYWGLYSGADPAKQLEAVRAAERLGYDSVWTAEAYGSDAATILAWFAAVTERIKLGSGVFQIPGRSAAMTAMTAATIDQISGGRMILGLGSSGPQVSEGWHGQHFGRQLQRTREYVEVVRMALARERVVYEGETLQLPLPDGPGKALKLTIAPRQERIPIYLAAIGPRNTALAGEIADGWLPTSSHRSTSGCSGSGLRSAPHGPGVLWTVLRSRRWSAPTSPRIWRRLATSCGRRWRCMSAGWARASRTSTSR